MTQTLNTTAPIRTTTAHGGARIVGGYDDTSGPGPELLTARTLTGNEVFNRTGDKLGVVDEIMLDVQSGRIAYAVLASGKFLGLGGKLFAIPWSSLELDADRKCFVMDASKERFEDAPGFDKDRWPSYASDSQWHRDVHAHYGASKHFWD